MRKKIYNIVEPAAGNQSIKSNIYNIFILSCIIFSMLPLATKSDDEIFTIIDLFTSIVFIIDYILRLITADYKLNKGKKSYLLYPIQPIAIIDLIAILTTLIPMGGIDAFRLLRLVRTFKVLKSFKIFRYSKNINRIINVLKKQAKPLGAVMSLALFYVIFTALIMFNIEPDTFNNFFEAIYWATISLTSVGYGDICPASNIGRFFTIISAFVGVAIIALPSGIITAGYIDILNEENNNDK